MPKKAITKAAGALPLPRLRQLVELGKRISDTRRRLRIPRNKLADRMLIGAATIQRIEKGDSTVSIGYYLAITDQLGMELLAAPSAGGTGTPTTSSANRNKNENWFK